MSFSISCAAVLKNWSIVPSFGELCCSRSRFHLRNLSLSESGARVDCLARSLTWPLVGWKKLQAEPKRQVFEFSQKRQGREYWKYLVVDWPFLAAKDSELTFNSDSPCVWVHIKKAGLLQRGQERFPVLVTVGKYGCGECDVQRPRAWKEKLES